jgi:hypothetical protein
VKGQRATNLRDPANIRNKFDFNTKNNIAKLGITHNKTLSLFDEPSNDDITKSYKNIIWFNKKSIKIAVADEYFEAANPLNIDFLIVNKYSGNNAVATLNNFMPKTLIIDSSVPAWQAQQWTAEAERRNLNYHYVVEKGAFVWKM